MITSFLLNQIICSFFEILDDLLIDFVEVLDGLFVGGTDDIIRLRHSNFLENDSSLLLDHSDQRLLLQSVESDAFS